ncbi:MAG: hypothetical protein MH208_18325 [Marinobacter sp.]|nr:hypothetical protein [Marinobacter sp.]
MRFQKQIIAFSCALALVGCAIQPPAETAAAIDREQLQIDPEVNYFVAVTELLSQRIAQPGGETLLQIQYAIEARSNGDLAWKVTWFDPQRHGRKRRWRGLSKSLAINRSNPLFHRNGASRPRYRLSAPSS